MTTFPAQASTGLSMANEFVSSDFNALALHMNECQRSRGRFFKLRTNLEMLHATASPRIVTTGALLLVCGMSLMAFV